MRNPEDWIINDLMYGMAPEVLIPFITSLSDDEFSEFQELEGKSDEEHVEFCNMIALQRGQPADFKLAY